MLNATSGARDRLTDNGREALPVYPSANAVSRIDTTTGTSSFRMVPFAVPCVSVTPIGLESTRVKTSLFSKCTSPRTGTVICA